MMSTTIYVAVHGGAGYHGVASEQNVKSALKRACTRALQQSDGSSALSVVERAISVLEDDEYLNAGYGSNLTIDGTVECDAAVMDGFSGDFGSVGALSGVKNPIKLASAVLRHSREPDPLGRIRPMTLVASGAYAFASSQGMMQTVIPDDIISPRALREWQKWKSRLDHPAHDDDQESLPQDAMQDTVGAVAWDDEGNLAAGVSSGGLLLKYSGRIGEAAVYGAGCWAQQSLNKRSGMACSISGAGEQIIRSGLARILGEALQSPQADGGDMDIHQVLLQVLKQQFTEPLHQRGELMPNAGVLLLTKERSEDDEVVRYGARSPQKAWRSHMQAPENPHLRHPFCDNQHRLAPP